MTSPSARLEFLLLQREAALDAGASPVPADIDHPRALGLVVLDLGDGESLSAASFLTASFPRTVFLNACLSGELDPRHGTEPIALSTMALCRGADTVVAGQFPLPDGPSVDPDRDHVTARILAHTYEGLAEGLAPAVALRRAQRAIRADSLFPVPLNWAGLIALGLPH